jgi:hypothetical protein
MKILCTGKGTYSGAALVEGRYYNCEDAANGTLAQCRAAHALLQEFWASGAHSYNAKSFMEFRAYCKRDLGAGFASYKYVRQSAKGLEWGECRTAAELPEGIACGHDGQKLVAGKLKSFSRYTKKERMEFIDRLISAMTQAGVNSRKFEEILAGLNN